MAVPILILTFNRPKFTKQLFEVIEKYKPEILFISSDGPRKNNSSDNVLIEETRSIFNDISWNCEVHKRYNTFNKGCKDNVNEAITWFFNNVENGIILEDDCLPNENFFKFMEKGLSEFKYNPLIGMISGSNLIDYKYSNNELNGFSNYINIWGWATWRRVWQNHNVNLTKKQILNSKKNILKKCGNDYLLMNFWIELLIFTINKKSTWDFQLQLTFFKENLISVYPSKNTVLNIGFEKNGTHTHSKAPNYIIKSKPNITPNIFDKLLNKKIIINHQRDKYLLKTIWNYSLLSLIKLKIRNFLGIYN